ncbi:hypothetical protein KA183_08755 [bacterium]|nr:hypothetical protein [bacterium]
MFELSGISIFGIVTALLALVHFAFRKLVFKSEAFKYTESALLVAFVMSTFTLYASSPFIHMFTPSLSEQVEQYFAPLLCLHLGLIFISVMVFLLSLTPLYKRMMVRSIVLAKNFYAFATSIILVAVLNLAFVSFNHGQSLSRQYEWRMLTSQSGFTYALNEEFTDLNADAVLLESWISCVKWTPWILLLILGSTNFSGLMQAMRKK